MTDPTAQGELVLAKPHLDRIRQATEELRAVRDKLEPIHRYYFTKSWLLAVTRILRLSSEPDFSKYVQELKNLRDEAWRIVEDAKEAVEAVRDLDIEQEFKRMAYLSYKQVDLDGGAVILMYQYVKAMNDKDPEAATYFFGMKEMSDEAHTNLAEMQRLADVLGQSV